MVADLGRVPAETVLQVVSYHGSIVYWSCSVLSVRDYSPGFGNPAFLRLRPWALWPTPSVRSSHSVTHPCSGGDFESLREKKKKKKRIEPYNP